MASNPDNTERVISNNQEVDRCVETKDVENKGKYCYWLATKMFNLKKAFDYNTYTLLFQMSIKYIQVPTW